MSEVFISYSHEDRERARELARALEALGWTIFWDRQIRPGQRFAEVIEQELDTAACVIVLWSQTSVRSEWVNNEASVGLKRRVLLPVIVDEHAKLPLEFLGRQTVSLTDWHASQPHEGFSALVSEIKRITGPRQSGRLSRSPTQRPPPAAASHLAGPRQPDGSQGSHRQQPTPGRALRPCAITVNIFTGARTLMPAGTEVLLTLRDGNQSTVPLSDNGYFKVPTINIEALPFFDNFGDNYTVVAWAHGCFQAGITPVKVNPQVPAIADIMLLRKDATFNFRDAHWDSLRQNHANYAAPLLSG